MDDNRLIDLEIRYTHMETLVNELNLIVARQQLTIDKLEKGVVELLKANVKSDVQGNRTLKDEVPPHY